MRVGRGRGMPSDAVLQFGNGKAALVDDGVGGCEHRGQRRDDERLHLDHAEVGREDMVLRAEEGVRAQPAEMVRGGHAAVGCARARTTGNGATHGKRRDAWETARRTGNNASRARGAGQGVAPQVLRAVWIPPTLRASSPSCT